MKRNTAAMLLFLAFAFLFAAAPAAADDWSLASSRLLTFMPKGSVFDGGNNFNAIYAARLIDGTVLKPGEAFSFNQILGPRTIERGYAVGQNSLNEPDVGGGICREATVVYQAAKDAGLEIIERNTHTPYVNYALPGEDAAVQYGLYDMRFINNSGVPVMIRTRGDMEGANLRLWAVLLKKESPKIVKMSVTASVYSEFDGSLINGKTFVPASKITAIYEKKLTLTEKYGYVNINAGGLLLSEVSGEVIRSGEGYMIPLRKWVNCFGGTISWTPGDVPLLALNTKNS
jgi:hypothetical protein